MIRFFSERWMLESGLYFVLLMVTAPLGAYVDDGLGRWLFQFALLQIVFHSIALVKKEFN